MRLLSARPRGTVWDLRLPEGFFRRGAVEIRIVGDHMAGSTFKTNPFDLVELLKDCESGALQLPDFQRSWVWDEDRIKSLIASVSRAFPIGALMTLDTQGPARFKPRPVEGAPDDANKIAPLSLLLDGQQRMTSLFQVTLRGKVVATVTPKKKKVKRWFYLDIRKALDPAIDREDAIVGVPEDRIVRTDFGREVVLDLSSPQKEYAARMFPVSQVFDWDSWQDGFDKQWSGESNEAARDEFRTFKRQVLENFKSYRVPVIALDRTTSRRRFASFSRRSIRVARRSMHLNWSRQCTPAMDTNFARIGMATASLPDGISALSNRSARLAKTTASSPM
jgi:hypothetical protein